MTDDRDGKAIGDGPCRSGLNDRRRGEVAADATNASVRGGTEGWKLRPSAFATQLALHLGAPADPHSSCVVIYDEQSGWLEVRHPLRSE